MATLITGVSRGIGRGVARSLASSGRPLIVTARDEAAARAFASELGAHVQAFGLDVTNDARRRALAAHLVDAKVTLSLLIHNAAIYERSSTPETSARTLATNVFAPIRLTEALLPVLASDARLVLVSSSMGQLHSYSSAMRARFERAATQAEVEVLAAEYLAAGGPDGAERAGFSRDAYSVSKALINALAQAWARQFPGRTVVAASPGWVKTDMGGPGAPRSLAQGVARIVEAATTSSVRSGAFYADSDPFAG
jgi:NAD(P)-dependent dehydrogenase (short-subunit alcohol dehydrogenase family)